MVPKLIALDLDETLLDENSQFTGKNRAALDRAMDRGIEIVVATGRALTTVPEEILHHPRIRFAITGNGAVVQNLHTGEILARRVLDREAPVKILRRMAGLDVTYEVFVAGKAYAQADYFLHLDEYLMDDQRQDYVRNTRLPVPDVETFLLAHREELESLAVIPRTMEDRAEVRRRLRDMPGVYVTTSNVRLIEINHASCTKAAGLRFLADYLSIAQGDTAAFGNGDNDADMLAWAGIGVSVAEGSDLCRAAADYVTGSYTRDGVAEALEQLFHI